MTFRHRFLLFQIIDPFQLILLLFKFFDMLSLAGSFCHRFCVFLHFFTRGYLNGSQLHLFVISVSPFDPINSNDFLSGVSWSVWLGKGRIILPHRNTPLVVSLFSLQEVMMVAHLSSSCQIALLSLEMFWKLFPKGRFTGLVLSDRVLVKTVWMHLVYFSIIWIVLLLGVRMGAGLTWQETASSSSSAIAMYGGHLGWSLLKSAISGRLETTLICNSHLFVELVSAVLLIWI